MAYTYRFLTAEQRTEIGKRTTTPPAASPPDEALQRAWEPDLAAHQAVLSAANDDETKVRHGEAVNVLEKSLEKALTKAAATSR
jgi:hypothetical protein